MTKELRIIKLDEDDANELTFAIGDLVVGLLSCIYPGIGLIAGVTVNSGKILKIWSDKLNDRNQEARKYVDRDDLVELVEDSDFRDKVLSLAQKLWEEPIKEKRGLYYSYINNLNSESQSSIDFTKLMSSIANLEIYDIELLITFADEYERMTKEYVYNQKRDQRKKNNNYNKFDPSSIDYRPYMINGLPKERVHAQMSDPRGEGAVYSPYEINNSLNTLSNFGAISVSHGFHDGSHYGPVTPIGREIIKYFIEYKEK